MKNSDILIYIQKIRNYLETSEEAKKYFLADINIEIFMNEVYKISEKNFNINGNPLLSPAQMDKIKNDLSSKNDNSKFLFFSMN
jgi:hypothetical protein